MRRRKDEEREARERQLVSSLVHTFFFVFFVFFQKTLTVVFLTKEHRHDLSRRKKPKLDKLRRKKLLPWSLKNGKGHFQLMMKVLQKMKFKMETKTC